LKRIIAGTQLFSIDQQPYLQGFYATMEAFQYAKYGVLPSAIVQTGPSLVVKANAALALAGAAAGVRGNS
jgi:simple sugar transport system substrate-binding protein